MNIVVDCFRYALWFAFFIVVLQPTQASAATTRLCNAANEELYLSVRHFAPSIFIANARTEGWIKLPTRGGLLRSCWNGNRHLRDHIVVVGVKRGNEIVPIIMTPRNAIRGRARHLCVPIKATRFEYRSNNRSDTFCPKGQHLARASFSVEGGKNTVDMDLSGSIDVVLSPEQKSQIETAKREDERRKAAENARIRKEREKEESAKKALEELRDMPDSQYLKTVSQSAPEDYSESIEIWTKFLEGKTLKLTRGHSVDWVGLGSQIVFSRPALVVGSRDEQSVPSVLSKWSELNKSWAKINSELEKAEGSNSEDAHVKTLKSLFIELESFASRFQAENGIQHQFRKQTKGSLSAIVAASGWSLLNKVNLEQDAVLTSWEVFFFPAVGAIGLSGNYNYAPALCFKTRVDKRSGYVQDYACYILNYEENNSAKGWSVSLSGPMRPAEGAFFKPRYEDAVFGN